MDFKAKESLIATLPSKSRLYAALWFSGEDLSLFLSRNTFARHAKILSQYGIDLSKRFVLDFHAPFTVSQLAESLGFSSRQVRYLLFRGHIFGEKDSSGIWRIPIPVRVSRSRPDLALKAHLKGIGYAVKSRHIK